MIKGFKLWSEVSPKSKEVMRPFFELRKWSDLERDDKVKIVRHLRTNGWLKDKDKFVNIAIQINDKYKVNTYAERFFEHSGPHSYYGSYNECCQDIARDDFSSIVFDGDEAIALEALSFYAASLIEDHYLRGDNPTPEAIQNGYGALDRFSNAVNDVFDHFCVDLTLSRQGLLPKQEKIVEEYVQAPLIAKLVGKKWTPVQLEFGDAIDEYNKGTKESYSNAITHLASALQAFLQISVNGSVGKGDIDALIRKGINEGLLPNDELSKKIINGLKSTLMEVRQNSGDAHPKKEYANERSVRLVLNIVAVFIQHCIV